MEWATNIGEQEM